jgi:arrestin-related trafficking adapter 4/5/7
MRTSSVPRIASMPDASERGRLRGTPDIGNISLGAQSTELYLSLGRRPSTTNSCTNAQLPGIGGGSLPPSQSSSRASSPERMGDTSNRSSRHNFGIKPFTTVFKSKSKTSTPSSSRPGSSHRTNNNNNNNKNPSAWPGAGSHKFSLSRSSSGPSTPSPEPTPQTLSSSIPTPSTATSTSPPLGYYDAVPEYSFAALGFLGGGITPLSSLRGLPSYDQAERSRHNLPTNSAGTPSDINRLTGGRSRSGTRSSRPSVERTSRGRSRSGGSPPRRLSENQQGP